MKTKKFFLNSCYSQKIKKEFETVFDEIIGLDKYSGLILFFIICLYYEKERNISDVTKRICIFTQYDINFDDFLDKINEKIPDHRLSELGITKYIKDIEKRFWHKNKDEDKLKCFIEYDKYAEILRKNLDNCIVERYIKLLKEKDDKGRIGDNLKEIRIIYENIFKACLEKIPDMKENCTEASGKLTKEWMNWLESKNYINSIQRKFFSSIYKIGSAFGGHLSKKAKIYKPSLDTVNSLLYALKDIILWFDKIS